MTTHVQELFPQIAKLQAFDVSQAQIASTLGLSEGRISQICEMPEYQAVYRDFVAEHYDKLHTLNDGWDAVEAQAVQATLTYLQNQPDPEFALRASRVANAANRRGSLHNRTINPTGANGTRAVIQLGVAFIAHLNGAQAAVVDQSGNGASASAQDAHSAHSAQTAGNVVVASQPAGVSQTQSQIPQKSVDMLPPGQVHALAKQFAARVQTPEEQLADGVAADLAGLNLMPS